MKHDTLSEKNDYSTRLKKYSRKLCRHLFTSRMIRIVFGQFTLQSPRGMKRWFSSCDRERVQNATDADESPRASAKSSVWVAAATTRRFSSPVSLPVGLPLRLSIGRHLFPLSCTDTCARKQLHIQETWALKFKKRDRSVFSRDTRQRWFWDTSRGHSRIMTCCRVIDCPEKHVCATGTRHNREQVVRSFLFWDITLYCTFYRFSTRLHHNFDDLHNWSVVNLHASVSNTKLSLMIYSII